MGDLTITAASVIPGDLARFKEVVWGGTITPGIPVYVATDGMYEACDADVAASALCAGIALTSGSDGQRGFIQTEGYITIGATIAIGQTYVVSTNAGKIALESDITTGDFMCILGVAYSATVLKMGILYSSVAHA